MSDKKYTFVVAGGDLAVSVKDFDGDTTEVVVPLKAAMVGLKPILNDRVMFDGVFPGRFELTVGSDFGEQ